MRDKSQKPFPKYGQIQNGILHVMVAALFEVQNYFFLVKFLCFLSISEMFNEPYLLQFPGDSLLILWQQFSCFSLKAKTNTSKTHSLAADVTISSSFPQSHHLYTSPQLSTDIHALWSTDALVKFASLPTGHGSMHICGNCFLYC